jgi:hypothetical protein
MLYESLIPIGLEFLFLGYGPFFIIITLLIETSFSLHNRWLAADSGKLLQGLPRINLSVY